MRHRKVSFHPYSLIGLPLWPIVRTWALSEVWEEYVQTRYSKNWVIDWPAGKTFLIAFGFGILDAVITITAVVVLMLVKNKIYSNRESPVYWEVTFMLVILFGTFVILVPIMDALILRKYRRLHNKK